MLVPGTRYQVVRALFHKFRAMPCHNPPCPHVRAMLQPPCITQTKSEVRGRQLIKNFQTKENVQSEDTFCSKCWQGPDYQEKYTPAINVILDYFRYLFQFLFSLMSFSLRFLFALHVYCIIPLSSFVSSLSPLCVSCVSVCVPLSCFYFTLAFVSSVFLWFDSCFVVLSLCRCFPVFPVPFFRFPC